jgi:CheY-like chemotaxis protein
VPISEIARRLEHPEGSVKSWLRRGRQQLAGVMEGYQTIGRPARPVAAIVHTDLPAPVLQELEEALRSARYRVKIHQSGVERKDWPRVLSRIGQCDLIILDEWIGGRAAFEFVMHLKAHPSTAETPIAVLCSSPSDFTAVAYFAAGVDRLADKARAGQVATIAAASPGPRPTRAHGLAGKRVILCDDETITLMQLERAFSGIGMSVVGTARDGKEAVETVLRGRPDLVIMDLNMPVMDGLEATRHILTQYPVCIVAITAYPDLQAQAQEAGLSGYITKPVDSASLLLQLQQAWAACSGSRAGPAADPGS